MQQEKQKKPFFELFTNKNVDMKKEFIAGLTTFLTMAYIIAVNPNILGETGMDKGAIVTATCLAAAFASIHMLICHLYWRQEWDLMHILLILWL